MPQRGINLQPKVARNELPWVTVRKWESTPTGLWLLKASSTSCLFRQDAQLCRCVAIRFRLSLELSSEQQAATRIPKRAQHLHPERKRRFPEQSDSLRPRKRPSSPARVSSCAVLQNFQPS